MTCSAHTPGPWTVAIPIELTFPDDRDRQESAYEIQTEDGGTTLCYAVGTDADTRLIVAAPDLLAALRGMVDAHDQRTRDLGFAAGSRDDDTTRAARAALSRAEGGAR